LNATEIVEQVTRIEKFVRLAESFDLNDVTAGFAMTGAASDWSGRSVVVSVSSALIDWRASLTQRKEIAMVLAI